MQPLQLHADLSVYFWNGHNRWIFMLKAQFIPPDFPFESARFDSVQRRWDSMAEDSEANSKELNNGLIKLPRATKF